MRILRCIAMSADARRCQRKVGKRGGDMLSEPRPTLRPEDVFPFIVLKASLNTTTAMMMVAPPPPPPTTRMRMMTTPTDGDGSFWGIPGPSECYGNGGSAAAGVIDLTFIIIYINSVQLASPRRFFFFLGGHLLVPVAVLLSIDDLDDSDRRRHAEANHFADSILLPRLVAGWKDSGLRRTTLW